jgi:hypothetical protein
LLDAHGLHLVDEVCTEAEDPIAIAQQISRCGIPGKGFARLLNTPLRMSDAVTAKCTIRRRSCASTRTRNWIWNRTVLTGPPGLELQVWDGSLRRTMYTYAGFADINADLQQSAVDAWRASEGIVETHRPN